MRSILHVLLQGSDIQERNSGNMKKSDFNKKESRCVEPLDIKGIN
jgi:hypothetical protein